MAVIPKEPLEWLSLFRQQMDEIFQYLSSLEGKEGFSEQEPPLVDVYETPDSFVVEVELPGCAPKDISLSICCSTLVIEGMKRQEAQPGVNYICLERRYGRFCKAVEISPAADVDNVNATMAKGLLVVAFPWAKSKKTHIREIPIK
ncbi:Hsp20/alpha crystallin family protein [Geomonas sp. RF6]|uniref:Hsp20/alpha crystallin family protein n=1 Tax=Geomonas sp. RF6 TaxID=2897342 RepID=UPI001E3B5051|nr:Hsp20/alpha crystallin family protein [Geomonas sp. RF6]UFS71585.1 Hsp20/alpha crystallin family protein [Geomonas sp. RF6]